MLWGKYDSVILDLDGVVYIGEKAVPHAIESLNSLSGSVRITAATNNASRHRSEVASHLRALGLEISESEVVTAADAAASYLKNVLPAKSKLLVVGGNGLVQTLEEHDFTTLRAARTHEENTEIADVCDAVVEGHGTDTCWWDITTAIWAISRGKPWIATNRDLSVPLPFGTSIGNGGFVSMIENFTKIQPLVTGKPEKNLFATLIERLGLLSPLVIGDSLQTDIAGARNAGLDSLLVLTGVSNRHMLETSDILPTYVAEDLRILLQEHAPEELG